MCMNMHSCRIKATKPGLAFFSLASHKIFGCSKKLFINSFHTLLAKGAGIFNNLLSYPAKLFIHCCVIIINSPAAQDTTWAKFFEEGGIFRIVLIFWFFF